MRSNLIVELNEITIRDYTLIEDEGLVSLVSSRPELSLEYEEDEEKSNRHVIVIKGKSLDALLTFLSFIELPVKII